MKSVTIKMEFIKSTGRWITTVHVGADMMATYAGDPSFVKALEAAVENIPRKIIEEYMGS